MFENWWKLVSTEKIFILFLRISILHEIQQNEKYPYANIVVFLPHFGSASYLYQRMPMVPNVSPPIWQTYINTILNYLEHKKYCEAIMDDLLLFTPSKQSHMRKLEDPLKALLKNGLKISQRSANYSGKNCSTWATQSLFKRKEYVLNHYVVN